MNLTVLSYHKFVHEYEEPPYRFSRTYGQFGHDITKKIFDMITIDDGMSCQIKACAMLTKNNIRAKLFICTSLVGTPGYCTWEELKELSKYHDIENHSHNHKNHTEKDKMWQFGSIHTAQQIISDKIGKAPRFFVAPYNQYNQDTDDIVFQLQLQSIKGRINMLNISK